MKKLQDLKGAKALSKKEQQSVKGGDWPRTPKCIDDISCPDGFGCVLDMGICLPIPV